MIYLLIEINLIGVSMMEYTSTQNLFIYIKQQMLADGITIKELSKRMNKTQGATSALLRQNNVSLETLKEICDALNYKLYIDIVKKEHE